MTGLDLTSEVNYPLECQCLNFYLNSQSLFKKNASGKFYFERNLKEFHLCVS